MVHGVFACLCALLFCGAQGQIVGQKKMSGKFGSAEVSGQKPVTKVINLLKEMASEVEKEAEEDQETHDKRSCWCETNDKEKTKTIADAEHRVKELTSRIEELTATSEQSKIDIENLGESLAKGKKSLAEASTVRDKELAEFNKEDKDAIVAIQGLHGAVTTLKKHNALTQEAMLQVRDVVSHHMRISQRQLRTLGLAPKQRRLAASFLQQTSNEKTYSAGSGEIFGVLQAMKESFETNMAAARKEESRAAEEFGTMKQAKQEEITAAQTQKDSKEDTLASADEDNANSKNELKDTEEQLEADRVFLKDLKTECAGMDKEWDERSKMRQDELTSINEALKILTDDDARDLVGRTTDFIQTSLSRKSSTSSAQSRAARMLQKVAAQLNRPSLSLLATRMRGLGFASVIADIEAMVQQLNQEQQDEVKHKDYCVEEIHQNELDSDEKYHEQTNLKTKEANLQMSIKTLTEEITAAKAEIGDTQFEMKKASEIREKESKDFETVIADQRATINLLNKVVAKLNEFYNRKAASASLLEEDEDKPKGFQAYNKNDGAKAQGWGVVSMIKAITKESAKVVMDSTVNNNNAQLAYEEFARDANKSIKMLRKKIVDNTNQVAMDNADLARTQADIASVMKDLEALNEINQQIHVDCDFVVDNFEQRQKSRTNEMDALIEAKKMMAQA